MYFSYNMAIDSLRSSHRDSSWSEAGLLGISDPMFCICAMSLVHAGHVFFLHVNGSRLAFMQ